MAANYERLSESGRVLLTYDSDRDSLDFTFYASASEGSVPEGSARIDLSTGEVFLNGWSDTDIKGFFVARRAAQRQDLEQGLLEMQERVQARWQS